jgi:hypothetical protein
MSTDYASLPPDLPVPADDGAADHLPGLAVPSVPMPLTTGDTADLAELAAGLLVAYVYPRTGTPPRCWPGSPTARPRRARRSVLMEAPRFELGSAAAMRRRLQV